MRTFRNLAKLLVLKFEMAAAVDASTLDKVRHNPDRDLNSSHQFEAFLIEPATKPINDTPVLRLRQEDASGLFHASPWRHVQPHGAITLEGDSTGRVTDGNRQATEASRCPRPVASGCLKDGYWRVLPGIGVHWN
jgi:hypothetical protein